MAKKAPIPKPPRALRVDAQRNFEHIVEVARTVVAEQGAEASLRDIARRADVGLGTFYRHFPTRDALLETLLRTGFDRLAEKAMALETSRPPREALTEWMQDMIASARTYRGLASCMMATLNDQSSSLHASCAAMRTAAQRLLVRAQNAGDIRPDVDGLDLFSLINGLAWIADQAPSIDARKDHLFSLIMTGLERSPTKSGQPKRSSGGDKTKR